MNKTALGMLPEVYFHNCSILDSKPFPMSAISARLWFATGRLTFIQKQFAIEPLKSTQGLGYKHVTSEQN
jgi:hypothetical protein